MSTLFKEILAIPFEIIGAIVEAIAEKAINFCPPLIIFLFALIFFIEKGCASKFFGCLLIPVGIVALIIWLFF